MEKLSYVLVTAAAAFWLRVVSAERCSLISPQPTSVSIIHENHYRYEALSGEFLTVSFLITGLDSDIDNDQLDMVKNVSFRPENDSSANKRWNGTEVTISSLLELRRPESEMARYIEENRHIILRTEWLCHLDIIIRPLKDQKLNASLKLNSDDSASSRIWFEYYVDTTSFPKPVTLDPQLECAEGRSIPLTQFGETAAYTAIRSDIWNAYDCSYVFKSRLRVQRLPLALPRDLPTPPSNTSADLVSTPTLLAVSVSLGSVVILLAALLVIVLYRRKNRRQTIRIVNQSESVMSDTHSDMDMHVPSLYSTSSYPDSMESVQPNNHTHQGLPKYTQRSSPLEAVQEDQYDREEDLPEPLQSGYTNQPDGLDLYRRPLNIDPQDDPRHPDEERLREPFPNHIAPNLTELTDTGPSSTMDSSNHYETIELQTDYEAISTSDDIVHDLDENVDDVVSTSTVDSPQDLDETR